jgi:hypothetical protein
MDGLLLPLAAAIATRIPGSAESASSRGGARSSGAISESRLKISPLIWRAFHAKPASTFAPGAPDLIIVRDSLTRH